jgi:triphosphatase
MPAPGPPPSDVEVEWQFDALDLRPVERWLSGLPAMGSPVETADPAAVPALSAEPQAARRLVDAYLDTADWRIGRSGFVLRIRRRAGGTEVTLKDQAPANGGLRRRLEVTEPLPADGIGALGPDGPVGWRLRALVGSRPLLQVLEVRTRRRPFHLRISGGQVAELALDDTVIEVTDGEQPVRLRRVEVEVDPASVDRFEPVVTKLRSECGLQPATLSKFEAGLLASGLQIPSAPDLGPATLAASPSVGELAFVVLRRNLAAMLAHEAGTRLGEDPEELHDMRVATRRMRAALAMFSDALPARGRLVRDELGWLADALGAVRDLDVQIQRVQEWAEEVPEQDRGALGDLARLLARHRQEARRRLLGCLESARYERLVTSFSSMLRQGPSRRSAAARAPAVVVLPDLVRVRHRTVAKAAKRARRSGAADDFHRLRIRGKRLRYALEFVSQVYSGQTTKYVRDLVQLQDSLGLMQDARVAAERLHQLVVEEGSALSNLTVFVMGGVAERYRQEAAQLARKVPARLDSLAGHRWQQMIGYMDRRRLEATPHYGWTAAGALRPSAAPPPPVQPTGESTSAAAPEPAAPVEDSALQTKPERATPSGSPSPFDSEPAPSAAGSAPVPAAGSSPVPAAGSSTNGQSAATGHGGTEAPA